MTPKEWRATPEGKAWQKAYRQTPEYKEKARQYRQKAKAKKLHAARQRKYYQDPEYRQKKLAKQKEWYDRCSPKRIRAEADRKAKRQRLLSKAIDFYGQDAFVDASDELMELILEQQADDTTWASNLKNVSLDGLDWDTSLADNSFEESLDALCEQW